MIGDYGDLAGDILRAAGYACRPHLRKLPAWIDPDEFRAAVVTAIVEGLVSWEDGRGSKRFTWMMNKARWAAWNYVRAERVRGVTNCGVHDPDPDRFVPKVFSGGAVAAPRREEPAGPAAVRAWPVAADDTAAVDARLDCEGLLAGLDERERAVVLAVAGGASYREAGDVLGVTRQRVNQLYKRAVAKIRSNQRSAS